MGEISKISRLRCGTQQCQPCQCFPICLTDTEFDLTITGFADSTFFGSWPTCCSFFSYPVIDSINFSPLNGNYIIPYSGVGQYILQLAACNSANISAIQASGIVVGRGHNIACGGSPCDGQVASEHEYYVTTVRAILACSNTTGQMSMTPAFDCCTLSRSVPCSGGPSNWSVSSTSCVAALSLCNTAWIPNIRALPCEHEKTMNATHTRGTVVSSTCAPIVNCNSPGSVTAQGFIRR